MQGRGRIPETLVLPVQSRQKISFDTSSENRSWALWVSMPSPALAISEPEEAGWTEPTHFRRRHKERW